MGSISRPLDRGLTLLANAAVGAAGAGLVLMALVQFWQVFARYVLNSSPGWTEPVALLFMSFTVMLGAAVGVRRESHFGFFTFREMAPAAVQTALRLLSRLVALATGVALAVWGGQLMLDEWVVPMAGAPLPNGFRYAPLCVGGVLMTLFALERLVRGDVLERPGDPLETAPEA